QKPANQTAPVNRINCVLNQCSIFHLHGPSDSFQNPAFGQVGDEILMNKPIDTILSPGPDINGNNAAVSPAKFGFHDEQTETSEFLTSELIVFRISINPVESTNAQHHFPRRAVAQHGGECRIYSG